MQSRTLDPKIACMRSSDVVVIGGGLAGEETAGRIAGHDVYVALVEDRAGRSLADLATLALTANEEYPRRFSREIEPWRA